MKKILFLMTGVIFAAILLAAHPSLTARAIHDAPGSGSERQQILDATIQISLYSEDGKYLEQGLGTLVLWQGEELVVTHNHWHFFHNLSKAEILDAKNVLLMTMSRSEFQALVRYSDPGTMILAAPQGLSGVPARLGEGRAVQIGDRVTIARQSPADHSQVELLQAKIEAADTFEGKPVYRFMLQDERTIPGDSGGGMWLNGQLEGNSWGMYVQQETQTTIVAQLPAGFFQTMEAIQVQAGPADGERQPHGESEEQ